MIYGAQDRANAGARAHYLKALQPGLDLHIIENCKHLVQWDAADEFHRLARPFLEVSLPLV
jgi:pimeloyl-ACP methyl ester carboxylesterase